MIMLIIMMMMTTMIMVTMMVIVMMILIFFVDVKIIVREEKIGKSQKNHKNDYDMMM